MSAILELPEARERVVRWSVDDYEALADQLVEQGVFPKRSELIRGIVIKKMPKSPAHCLLAKWLYDHFMSQAPAGCVVFQESPLRLSDSMSMPEPDVSVARGSRHDFHAMHPTTAELVVEVAVTSAAMDREYASLYAEAGVEEYWIVLAQTQQVEVYCQPVNGVYQEVRAHRREETLACTSVSALSIALGELFT